METKQADPFAQTLFERFTFIIVCRYGFSKDIMIVILGDWYLPSTTRDRLFSISRNSGRGYSLPVLPASLIETPMNLIQSHCRWGEAGDDDRVSI